MEKYSIILPVRNGGEHVKECVNSILNQTLQNFNLIVLDNCSTDGTKEWIESLQHPSIILYSADKPLSMEENWGRIKNIQKNEFMTIIGHDDVLLPNYLDEMSMLIEKHPQATLYQSHYLFINADSGITGHCLPMDEIQYGHEFLACQFARTMNSMGTGYMMRSKDYDAVGGIPTDYPNLIFADYQLWVHLSLKNYKATTDKICFHYRIHNSVSKLTQSEKYQQAFEKYVYFLARLMKKDEKVKGVIEKYAYEFLMYFCESLSHRLLKAPKKQRSIKVNDLIEKFEGYANILIPSQSFEPYKKFKINIAAKLDSNIFGRNAFYLFKKLKP